MTQILNPVSHVIKRIRITSGVSPALVQCTLSVQVVKKDYFTMHKIILVETFVLVEVDISTTQQLNNVEHAIQAASFAQAQAPKIATIRINTNMIACWGSLTEKIKLNQFLW